MSDSSTELLQIAEIMDQLATRSQQEEIQQPLARLKHSAEEIGKAWSGSWLGYHAHVYYRGLQPRPPGAHFSQEWGFKAVEFHSTSGHWDEFDAEFIKKTIHERAGNPDLRPAQILDEEALDDIRMQKSTLYSILDVELAYSDSPFLVQIKEQTDRLVTQTGQDIIDRWMPEQIRSRDQLALDQGRWTPPHFSVLSQVEAIEHTFYIGMRLEELTKQTGTHISRQRRQRPSLEADGTRVFIGHGHSSVWRELKDFIQDNLGLPVDEFNRVATAGISITDRLSEMMNNAAFAFLVLTGEDEQPAGLLHARMNVIHEAGLFQGRLGFERAIVLLEDGCEGFSNINGLVHISFPKDHIRSTFEEIRRVLKREGILSTGV